MPYNMLSAPNFNTWAVPVITGVITMLIGGILVTLFKRYLRQSDDGHALRYTSLSTSIKSVDDKLTLFCRQNHEEHEKTDKKLVNHDHDPDTGKPRFYV